MITFARDWQGFGPVAVREQNPVYLQSLGLTPDRACVLPEGTFEVRIDSAYSNMFEKESNVGNSMNLDMEFWRLAPRFAYGIKDGMEVALEIPLVHFNGGFLDGFIQDFHRAFGFPNGGRNTVPNGLFNYNMTGGGVQRLSYPTIDMALGDISLRFKNQLTGEDDDLPALSWFAEVKFPTGKASRGWGSGRPDFGFGTILETSWKRLHGYVNAGYYVLGGIEGLENYMQGEMFAYSVAGEFSILPSWSLVVELNGSTALLNNTGMDQWDGLPLNLVVGFRGEEQKLVSGEDFIWQFGFSEDITSKGPSVDFTVFLSIGLRFDLFGKQRPAGDWIAKK